MRESMSQGETSYVHSVVINSPLRATVLCSFFAPRGRTLLCKVPLRSRPSHLRREPDMNLDGSETNVASTRNIAHTTQSMFLMDDTRRDMTSR